MATKICIIQHLAGVPIEPKETKTISIVLTKTLSANDVGMIINEAEIEKSNCKEGLLELDSVVNNKYSDEDDLGVASLIISINTGSPIMSLIIIFMCLLFIAGSAYIIKAKLVNKEVSSDEK